MSSFTRHGYGGHFLGLECNGPFLIYPSGRPPPAVWAANINVFGPWVVIVPNDVYGTNFLVDHCTDSPLNTFFKHSVLIGIFQSITLIQKKIMCLEDEFSEKIKEEAAMGSGKGYSASPECDIWKVMSQCTMSTKVP